jgi:hypothetical protein
MHFMEVISRLLDFPGMQRRTPSIGLTEKNIRAGNSALNHNLRCCVAAPRESLGEMAFIRDQRIQKRVNVCC